MAAPSVPDEGCPGVIMLVRGLEPKVVLPDAIE